MRLIGIIKSYRQQIFVVAAFFLMASVSCFYVNNIVTEQNRAQGQNVIENAELTVKSYLSEAYDALDNIILLTDDTFWVTSSPDEIQETLTALTQKMSETGKAITIHGYIGGAFVDGGPQTPSTASEAKYSLNDPWYKGAAGLGGSSYYAYLYPDRETNRDMISVSKEIISQNGENAGVLCVKTDAADLIDYVNSLSLMQDGYGILFDSNMTVRTHANRELIGTDGFNQYPIFYNYYFSQSQTPRKILGERVADYDGRSAIMYMSRLYNGWYLAVITPVTSYYANIYIIMIVMAFMAVTLSCILCYVLTMINKQKDRSELENLSKTSFLARISHEIRTPMNAIAGMSELILRKDVSPDVYDHAFNIKNASDNLLSIVNDILDYSKIESGDITITPGEYHFSSLLNDVISIIRMRIIDKPVRFVVNADSKIPDALYGDEARIRQILLNILSNSVKYTTEGFISVAIMADIDETEKTVKLTFEIADSGSGIKEENVNKIFGDFVKLDFDSTRTIQGTGLGLAITQSLCAAMGGEISAYSKYGEGTTLTVTLPQTFTEYTPYATVLDPETKTALIFEPRIIYANSVVCSIDNLGVKCTLANDESMFYNELRQDKYKYVFVSSYMLDGAMDIIKRLMLNAALILVSEYKDNLNVPDARVMSMPAHSLAVADILNDTTESVVYNFGKDTHIGFTAPTARILVVDDIKTNLQVAEGLMAPYNMIIDTALSGPEAIAMCKETVYDLVFMDHMMPEMDGIEAMHKIRELDDGSGFYKRLPIVTLTANAMAGMKEKFIQSGMDDFLAKPIELSKLNAILETWIPRNKMERYVKDGTSAQPAEEGVEIDGVNTKIGLAMTGGSWKNYKKTLIIYYYDTKQRLLEIPQKLEEGDIKTYTTFVHALKSASASIGAHEASSLAAALEDAATNGNMLFISEHNDKFMKILSDLVSSIEKVLLDAEPEEAVNDIPFLHETLEKLKTALDEMDMTTIDELMAKLDTGKWDKELSGAIENISQYVLLFEYESAIGVIDALIAEYIK